MVQSFLVVIAVLVGAGALLKGLGWARRSRIVAVVDAPVRSLRGVSLRVLTSGQVTMPNMNSGRANRTMGDLVLGTDRFVVASSRGKLLDVRPTGTRLSSVRCTGPGRLVIEGSTPATSGKAGGYRIELVCEDAPEWVAALQPFVDEEAEEFASLDRAAVGA